MLEKIGKIVVLGLEARADRWARCEEIFRHFGIRHYVYHKTEEDITDLWGKASRDFLAMVRLHFNGEFTVFLEDDFELAENYDTVLEKAWEDLPSDFDLLYMGANLTAPADRVSDNLVKLNGAWTVHGVIFSKKFSDYVIDNYSYERCGVFDEWLRKIAPDKNFYMTYPMVAWQRASYSNFTKSNVAYELFQNPYYKEL